MVARFNADGSLDTTFGTNGIWIHDVGGWSDRAHDVAIASNGDIVVGGTVVLAKYDGFGDMVVVRLDPSGALDTSFGDAGEATLDFAGDEDSLNALVLQPDSKVVVAGFANPSPDAAFAVARLTANGQLDTTFGDQGRVIHNFGANNDSATSVLLQPDGKILVGGGSVYPNDLDLALMRLLP